MVRTSHIFIPNSNAKMKTLTRSFGGGGYGTVLLDGGRGGQSSYYSIDNYIETTNQPKTGRGLADKININKSFVVLNHVYVKPLLYQFHVLLVRIGHLLYTVVQCVRY